MKSRKLQQPQLPFLYRYGLRLKDKEESLKFMSEILLIDSDAGTFSYFGIEKKEKRIIPFCSQALKCVIAGPT